MASGSCVCVAPSFRIQVLAPGRSRLAQQVASIVELEQQVSPSHPQAAMKSVHINTMSHQSLLASWQGQTPACPGSARLQHCST